MVERAPAFAPPSSLEGGGAGPRGRAGGANCRFPVLVLAGAALFALAAWLFAWPRATVTTYIPQDVWLLFDLIHRLDIGHAPHVDSHTPVGALDSALAFLAFRATGQLAGSLEIANVSMLAITLPIGAILLYRRTTSGIAIVFLIALAGMVVVPFVGESGLLVTQALFYNRWGWGLIACLFLAVLPLAPPMRGGKWLLRTHVAAEALSIAVALLLLFFLKITYFLVGLFFVVFFGVALARFLRTALLGLALFAPALLAVSLATGVVDDYLLDIARAIEVARNPGADRPTPSVSHLIHTTLPHIALGVVAVGVGALQRRPAVAQILYFAFVLASCIALALQNSQPPFLFALINVFVAVAASCSQRSPHRRLAMVAMCLFLAPTISRQIVASASFHLIARGDFQAFAADLPRMENAWFGNRAVNWFASDATDGSVSAFVWARRHRAEVTIHLTMSEQLETLRSGVALLRQQGVGTEPVATLDYVNCFPTLLNATAPRGVLYVQHPGRQMNRTIAKDRNLVFGDAAYLMIPTFPVGQESTSTLLALHQDHLRSAWKTVARNDHWQLLTKIQVDA